MFNKWLTGFTCVTENPDIIQNHRTITEFMSIKEFE